MFAGVVEQVGYQEDGLGHYVFIKLIANERSIFYAHFNPITLTEGTIVATVGFKLEIQVALVIWEKL